MEDATACAIPAWSRPGWVGVRWLVGVRVGDGGLTLCATQDVVHGREESVHVGPFVRDLPATPLIRPIAGSSSRRWR